MNSAAPTPGEGYITVSIDIKGPSTPFEPTALCLAERVKAFLMRDKITLSDDEETSLGVKKDSISIKLKDQPDDGLPIVGIGQAVFVNKVGDIVILQGTVISESEVTKIQWYKVEDDGSETEIKINNKRFLGGCKQSPSLVIDKCKKKNAGVYILEATNINGTARSTKSHLILISTGEEVVHSDSDDDSDTDDEDNQTNRNYSHVISFDTNDSDENVVHSTTDGIIQNGNSSHSEIQVSSDARDNETQNDVTSSSREDDMDVSTDIENPAAHTISDQLGDLGEHRSPAAEAVHTSDDALEEEVPGVAMTKEVEDQSVKTAKDSDDCYR